MIQSHRGRLGLAALGVLTLNAVLLPPSAHAQLSVEAIVAKVEPGIACVLVSRSDWYNSKNRFAEEAAPGELGGFAENRIELPVNLSQFERAKYMRALRQKYDLAFRDHIPEAFGSGIVIDADGLILTNYHVVQDATKVYVRLPSGKGSYANILAADPRSDLAVLKLIDESVRRLTPVPLGNADGVRRGQQVIALANPYAAGQHDGQPSVSVGVISNLRRRQSGRQPQEESGANPLYQYGILLQTDARIALGSSGGALVNMQGECIGITTSLAALAGSDAPGGFALPINSSVRKIISVLKKGEEVEYGFLGVRMADDASSGHGAPVDSAQGGSPAERAGLKAGDLIVALGNTPVRDNQDLMLALGHSLVGEKITLSIVRGLPQREQKLDVDATLVKYDVRGKKIATSLGNRPYVEGLRVDYTSIIGQGRFGGQQPVLPGVLVADVKKGSKAARLELFQGDTITEVGGVPVSTPAAFYEQLARQPGPVELTLGRGKRIRW